MINWFNHCYPYSNFHELNLDWVIYTVKKGEADIKNFIGLNTIKYADPILWDITRQYEANTVVVDPTTGNAYISTKAVPYGTHINNEDYWTQIYNYADVVDTLREQIAYNEGLSTTATRAYSIDNLVFTNTELYRVVAPMIAGDSFVTDSNVVKTTINDELLRLIDKIGAVITDLATEVQAREDADGVLQDNIDAEATAREDADTALAGDIDDIQGDISDLQATDTALAGDIADSISLFENALTLNREDESTSQNAYDVGDLLFHNNQLYRVISTIQPGYTFVVDSNIAPTTIEIDIDRETQAREYADTVITSEYTTRIHQANNNSGKKILFVGDSYADIQVGVGSWVTFVAQFMGLSSDQWVNSSVGGAGFANGAFLTKLQEGIAAFDDADEITDIVVCGGYNDYNSTLADLNNAISNFCSYAKTNAPYAKIHIGIIGNNRDDSSVTHKINTTVYDAYSQCAMHGASFINHLECVMHNYANFNDEIHPNIGGYLTIALYVANYLTGNEVHVRFGNINCTHTSSPSNVNIANFYLPMTLDNDNIKIGGKGFIVSFNTAVSISLASPIELLTLSQNYLRGGEFGEAYSNINCDVYYATTGGSNVALPNARLYVNNFKLYLAAMIPDTITNVSALRIQIKTSVLDTLNN